MARRRPTEPAANPARGAALVIVAVLIGLFLLRHGIDTNTTVTGGTDKGSSSTDSGLSGSTSSTSTSVVGLRSAPDTPTIVFNASGKSGVAKLYTTSLTNKGYHLTNATGLTAPAPNRDTSQVLFATGWQQEALAVASALKIPRTAVLPAAGNLPNGDTAGAQVYVVIGKDLKDTTPPA